MPTITYTDGVPCWVDLSTSDVDAATAFYGDLLGWEAVAAGPAEQTGGYTMFLKDGLPVAACAPLMEDGQPVAWQTYFSSDDVDTLAMRVAAAGGKVVVEPLDVLTAGRMAVFQDPGGAFFAGWQPGDHVGAQLVNEPGTLVWNELYTRDMDEARAFYAAALGLDGRTRQTGPMEYTEFRTPDERVRAGGMTIAPPMPDEIPPHWLAYFAVEDADAAVARVRELGGAVLFGPIEIPVGRFATVADPQGAVFGVMALADPPPSA